MKRRLVLAVVLVVASLHAQDAPAPQPPTFRAGANYVRVDVYPTMNGAPIADLRQDEFELLDNGIPQKIDQFERVQIRAAGPQDTRIEPNTVAESREMAQDARARVFVVFLDTYHVEIGGSHDIRAPLIKALDQIIGPDDLVGVMTPEMAASDVTFARKTTTIAGFLTRYWYWGERDRMIPVDPREQDYGICYGIGRQQCADGSTSDDSGVADAMIQRRHENLTLRALESLVGYLRGIREERKAILAITDGWLLYRPDQALARPLGCQVPGPPPLGVDPRGGKISMKAPPGQVETTQHDCDSDRLQLANMDDDLEFRRLMDEANRANASFYPIDPRGLPVFDTPIVPTSVTGAPPMVPPSIDAHMLQARLDSLRTLAVATDGLAILNSNDFDKGFKRVVDDLTSYYLLGYYTSAPLDGKFHRITVRVKRPGVKVRARRGYLALTPAEAARADAPPPSAAEMKAAAEAHAIDSVVAPLAGYGRELPLRLQTVTTATKIWVDGELGASEARGDWRNGGTVDVLLTNASGETIGSGHATVVAGGRTFEAAIAAPGAGEYEVRVRARPQAADALPINEAAKASVAAASAGVRYVRHGPGNREAPAADLRFRRSEAVRVEWPASGPAAPGDAHLLDRTGKPMPVPVAVASRDADGVTWVTAQVSVAPLAPGDYVIALQQGSERRLAGFRVVP